MEYLRQSGFARDFELVNLAVQLFRFGFVFAFERSERIAAAGSRRADADSEITIQVQTERILFEAPVIPHNLGRVEDGRLPPVRTWRHAALERQMRRQRE